MKMFQVWESSEEKKKQIFRLFSYTRGFQTFEVCGSPTMPLSQKTYLTISFTECENKSYTEIHSKVHRIWADS